MNPQITFAPRKNLSSVKMFAQNERLGGATSMTLRSHGLSMMRRSKLAQDAAPL